MSIKAINWALSRDEINNPGAKFVLVILANYANENNECYPSRETVARLTSMSVRSVQNHLNWLVSKGYIERENRRRIDQQIKTNLYKLKPSADSAHGAKSLVQNSTSPSADIAKPSANNVKEPSADSAHNTKGIKDEPSVDNHQRREPSSDDAVLKYYSLHTGNKITDKDREARKEVDKVDPVICKIGILLSIDRCHCQVESFRYCLGAIKNSISTADIDNPKKYLEYLESRAEHIP